MKSQHDQEFDFSQITAEIFLGTNLCCNLESSLKLLDKIGITADIDLEHERQDPPPKVDVYLWLPVKDRHAPTQEQLETGVVLLDKLIKTKKKVFVHCRLGHGRSPTLVAAYFISRGMSVKEAIQKIRDARPEIHISPAQLEALQTYASKQAK